MSKRRKQSQQRLRQFEEFEQRLMMSADPVAQLLPPLDLSMPRVVQTAHVAEVAPLETDAFGQSAAEQATEANRPSDAALQQTVESITRLAQFTNTNSPTTDAADIADRFGLDGSGQTVAVIDSGIAWDHNALGGGFGEGSRVVGGWDFAENDADPYDDGPAGFHGTHVAGIIGSQDDTYRGVSSGVDLVGLRVFDDQGNGDLAWVEQALQWVHEHKDDFANPITTVNLSLGTTWNADNTPDWATLEDEFAQLEADGLFISVAAGNSFEDYNTPGLSYPAASPHVVPVASHGTDNTISDFSQRNDRILAAPGESIRSTVPDFLLGHTQSSTFLGSTGTSMAAPYVAGASAILREAYHSVGVENVNQSLLYQQFRETASQVYDSVTSAYYHQINLEAAIEAVMSLRDAKPADPQPEPSQPAPPTAPAPTEPQPADPQPPATAPPEAPVADFGATLSDGTLAIRGTAGDDSIALNVSDSQSAWVTINGQTQRFELGNIAKIQVQGGAGDDNLYVKLGQTSNSVVLQNGGLYVSNAQFSIASQQLRNIEVVSGGQNDMLSLLDSAGNDQVTVDANAMSSTVSNSEFYGVGRGFTQAYTTSTGGHDTLRFVGSHGDDTFVSNAHRNMLRNDAFQVVGDHFASIQFDGNGGSDHANLYGTDGHDVFVLRAGNGSVTTDTSQLELANIHRINVFSNAGGDRLKMYDSAGDDLYTYANNVSVMQGEGFLNFAWNIGETQVFASDGYDLAQIQDSVGNDVLTTDGAKVKLDVGSATTQTHGFDRVNVVANQGGYDTATMVGTSGDDWLYADQSSVSIGLATGQLNRAVGFEDSNFDGGAGHDHSTLMGSSESEKLSATADDVSFETTRQMLQMVNVEQTNFDGNGGIDQIAFEGFEPLDLLSAIGDEATAVFRDHSITATDFDVLEAETVDDAIAEYDLESVDFLYLLRGGWKPR